MSRSTPRAPTRRASPVLALALVTQDAGLAAEIREVADRSVVITVLPEPLDLIDSLADRAYDVVVLDEHVPLPGSGIVLARALRAAEHSRHVGIVLRATRTAEAESLADAVLGADATADALWAGIREAGRRCRERLAAAP